MPFNREQQKEHDIEEIKRAYVEGVIDLFELDQGLDLLLNDVMMDDETRESYGLAPWPRAVYFQPLGSSKSIRL